MDVQLRLFLPGRPIILELLCDSVVERVVRLRLEEEIVEGLEDVDNFGAGLPVLWLEQGQADVARALVRHVGVVDAGDELDDRRLEGVVCRQGEEDAELAGRVDGGRGGPEGDVPCVQRFGGGEGDGECGWGGLREVGVFLDSRAS